MKQDKTLTYGALLDAVAPLKELQSLKLTPRTSLEVSKLIKALDNELIHYNETKSKVITDNTKDGVLNVEQATKEMNELLATTFTVSVYSVNFSEIERNNATTTSEMYTGLSWLITLDDAVEEKE